MVLHFLSLATVAQKHLLAVLVAVQKLLTLSLKLQISDIFMHDGHVN